MNAADFMDKLTNDLVPVAEFKGPTWYYDSDGDCIEFLISGDRFYGERKNAWVTAYYSYVTGQLIGSQIKGIRRLMDRFPGFKSIEMRDGKVRLSHIYRATGWACTHNTDEIATMYGEMMDVADRANAEVELATA